jgi:hypothetical protein
MKFLSLPIMMLLVLALLVQNTCPHGFAGKSALAKSCGHCPHHKDQSPQHGLKSMASHPHIDQAPAFVFSVPAVTRVVAGLPIETTVPLLDDDLKDALPADILKPPRA